jgi:hypothetical protein
VFASRLSRQSFVKGSSLKVTTATLARLEVPAAARVGRRSARGCVAITVRIVSALSVVGRRERGSRSSE